MVDYDLTEFGRRPYGRASQAMRFGMAAFALGLGGWLGWQSYLNIISKGLSAGYVVGIVGIYFILGMFLYMAAIQRAQAARLLIDHQSVRLIYRRGAPYVLSWSDPDLILQGRRTPDSSGLASWGRPAFSIYGSHGGFTESGIPESAYRELVAQSASRGLVLAERHRGPNSILWAISPANT
jgi:hypothetical protein